jgi:diguanylate cyclase (GGDEF)-like protein
MPYYSPGESLVRERSDRFLKRMYLMRMLGTFLCFFPVLSVLLERQVSWIPICLLALNAFVWPHVAMLISHRAKHPNQAEFRNLAFDAIAGGAWVALMGVCPLPSAIITSILIADRFSAGGWHLLRRAALFYCAGFLVCWLAAGMPFYPVVTDRTLWLTLPLSTIYIIAFSAANYSISRKLRDKQHELEKAALMDPFLGLPNRRLLDRRLMLEFERSKHDLSCLMVLGVDDLKMVNDLFGREAGDYVLRSVSAILRHETGQNDFPAILGGDEFVVILPGVSEEEAYAVGYRLLLKTSEIRLSQDSGFQCSLSIGVATSRHHENYNQWLAAAERALVNVKKNGKNSIGSVGRAELAAQLQ